MSGRDMAMSDDVWACFGRVLAMSDDAWVMFERVLGDDSGLVAHCAITRIQELPLKGLDSVWSVLGAALSGRIWR